MATVTVYVVEERQEPVQPVRLWDCMVLGVAADLPAAILIVTRRAAEFGVRDSLVQRGDTFSGGGFEWVINEWSVAKKEWLTD